MPSRGVGGPVGRLDPIGILGLGLGAVSPLVSVSPPRAAESCRKAIGSSAPWYAHIDACITMPEQEARRSRYKCLKTPWTNSRGDRVLMITSVLTPDVDIPLVPRAA